MENVFNLEITPIKSVLDILHGHNIAKNVSAKVDTLMFMESANQFALNLVHI